MKKPITKAAHLKEVAEKALELLADMDTHAVELDAIIASEVVEDIFAESVGDFEWLPVDAVQTTIKVLQKGIKEGRFR